MLPVHWLVSGCMSGQINIAPQDLSLQLENGGVVIKGLGTVTYDATTGDFHLAVDPNGQLANLGYGETADIKFEVTATDLAGCSDSTCFDFTADGGDHGVTVAACIIDGDIQMASDCASCGCVETPPNLPPVDLLPMQTSVFACTTARKAMYCASSSLACVRVHVWAISISLPKLRLQAAREAVSSSTVWVQLLTMQQPATST